METCKPRLLFISENITLAQIVRLKELADCLDETVYDIYFACASFPDLIFAGSRLKRITITSISKEYMNAAIKAGKPLYSLQILKQYIAEELAIFNSISPDVVIGDFRLSLSISAAKAKIPYINLINAYWNPSAERKHYPVPEHPTVKWFGHKAVSLIFPIIRPSVFKQFAKPVNTLRKQNDLPYIGSLEDVLTYGDYVLYPDVPYLNPVKKLHSNHSYIGPVLWSPKIELPPITQDKPIIYITMGSSGDGSLLKQIIQSIQNLSVQLLVSGAGAEIDGGVFPNVIFSAYLPGSKACEVSALVICNGGSSTAYQALSAGKPVIGIPSNLDQYLSMTCILEKKAGILIRSDAFTAQQLQRSVIELLNNKFYTANAQRIASEFNNYSFPELFKQILEKALIAR